MGEIKPFWGKNVKEIVGNDELRARKCSERINQILTELDCILVPERKESANGIQWGVIIQPKPREAKNG